MVAAHQASLSSHDKEKEKYNAGAEEQVTAEVLTDEQLVYLISRMGYDHPRDLSDVPASVRYLESKLACGIGYREMLENNRSEL